MSRCHFLAKFCHKKPFLAMFSVKRKLSRHPGGPSQCHQMTHGGGARGLSKIGQKSVKYYLNLNGPKLK